MLRGCETAVDGTTKKQIRHEYIQSTLLDVTCAFHPASRVYKSPTPLDPSTNKRTWY